MRDEIGAGIEHAGRSQHAFQGWDIVSKSLAFVQAVNIGMRSNYFLDLIPSGQSFHHGLGQIHARFLKEIQNVLSALRVIQFGKGHLNTIVVVARYYWHWDDPSMALIDSIVFVARLEIHYHILLGGRGQFERRKEDPVHNNRHDGQSDQESDQDQMRKGDKGRQDIVVVILLSSSSHHASVKYIFHSIFDHVPQRQIRDDDGSLS
jgi:hypothetical protein